MRGNNVMKGYFDNPEATDDAFRGGYFHSGDIAVWHPDNYIDLRDRSKDIIISGGENISTIEVERAIASHPDVLESAVVAVPNEKWGERPKAFVVLKEGASTEPERSSSTSGRDWLISRRRTRSRWSPSYQRRRPARSRSTSCVTRSGPVTRNGSTSAAIWPANGPSVQFPSRKGL